MATASAPSAHGIPLAFATCSLGHPETDSLHRRLEAIASAGFSAIELSFPDLKAFASQFLKHEVKEDDYDELCQAASEVKRLCEAHELSIMMLQPFSNFEGWRKGTGERNQAWERVKGWSRIMQACGTDMLQIRTMAYLEQVGSTDTPAEKISTEPENIVNDIRELCDFLKQHNMKVAYENWCWSTHAATWKEAWHIVQQVDRPNIGLCLDTFQIAGSEWANPCSISGCTETEVTVAQMEDVDESWQATLEELSKTVPKEKIYLLQISDAYRPQKPFEGAEKGGMPPRARWSHAYRPLPYDGGYLPVESVTRAVLKTGFRGWFSVEVFDEGPDGKGRSRDLFDFAKKARDSAAFSLRRRPILTKTSLFNPGLPSNSRPDVVGNRTSDPESEMLPKVYSIGLHQQPKSSCLQQLTCLPLAPDSLFVTPNPPLIMLKMCRRVNLSLDGDFLSCRAGTTMASSKPTYPLEGGCDCGMIRYRMETAPLIVHCCHCTWCQRETGSSSALNAMIELSSLTTLTPTKPFHVSTPSASGRGQTIARCPHCYVAVWSHYIAGGLLPFVRVGTLDKKQQVKPDVHIFTSTKFDWVDLSGSQWEGKVFEEFYDREKVWSPGCAQQELICLGMLKNIVERYGLSWVTLEHLRCLETVLVVSLQYTSGDMPITGPEAEPAGEDADKFRELVCNLPWSLRRQLVQFFDTEPLLDNPYIERFRRGVENGNMPPYRRQGSVQFIEPETGRLRFVYSGTFHGVRSDISVGNIEYGDA
ncbi:conserved hypothetical protein [Uncinocarpus reesii 1704]|uniref:CENP-V/GFA domain-containing protein n=1 Tax=Uncinocarpus reesii (strain UAMH 1704) TaxID=336963 RepID=C4JUN2_UNCRE|nr:uncharacterized protein UREG_04835 [Uncinocarpus reesii 1704]EEP79993.1 conserved hypothetical protein [Uncinocarpus reesii 1704]